MIDGRTIPAVSSHCSDEAISFAIDVIDASGVAQRLEELLAKGTGRPRTLPLRALLVALFLLCAASPHKASSLACSSWPPTCARSPLPGAGDK